MTPWQVALIAAFGPVATVILAVASWRQNRRRGESEIGLTDVQKQKFMQDIGITREADWQRKFDSSESKLEGEISELRDELQVLRRFIERHVPWDWKAIRELRLLGSTIEDPPTLTYLRDPDDH